MCTEAPSTDQVQRYAAAGVHRLVLSQQLFTQSRDIELTKANLERFARQVLEVAAERGE